MTDESRKLLINMAALSALVGNELSDFNQPYLFEAGTKKLPPATKDRSKIKAARKQNRKRK